MPKEKYAPPNPRRTYSIMSQEDQATGKKSKWLQLEISGSVRNLSPELWSLQHLTALFLNDNCLYYVPVEITHLSCLMCLDLSSNRLCHVPGEIGDLTSLRELLLNNNQIRVLPFELGRLFQLLKLGIAGNPMSGEIMSIHSEPNGTSKLISFLLDNIEIHHSSPPNRPWVHLNTPSRSRTSTMFTVMSYNVLCDKYATKQVYGYCPTWGLGWEFRKKGIMSEILQFTADIISLQEVETEQYYHFFLPQLKLEGYDGVFAPKSRAKTMSEHESKHVDGCAIFYRLSKFQLAKEHLIEFNQLAMANAAGSHDMLNRVMTKDNIGIVALLEVKDSAMDDGYHYDRKSPSQLLMVANVHIHWDPEYSDVKLIQTILLMNELRTMSNEYSHSFRPRADGPNTIPLVLCGDLNSLPESGVIEFLNSGRVAINHSDFKDLVYDECLSMFTNPDNPTEVTHSFQLNRSYEGNPMTWTNFTYDFKGIIDYIFYSRNYLRALGVLGEFHRDWLSDNKVLGCPHPGIPSDHFSLLSEYELLPCPASPSGGSYHAMNGYSGVNGMNALNTMNGLMNGRR